MDWLTRVAADDCHDLVVGVVWTQYVPARVATVFSPIVILWITIGILHRSWCGC